MQTPRACLVLGLWGAMGCGQISDRTVQELPDAEGGSSGAAGLAQAGRAGGLPASGGAMGGGGMPGAAGMPIVGPCAPQQIPTPLRALSSWEYRRSLAALTGKPVTVALPADPVVVSYFDVAMNLNPPLVEALFTEAEAQGAALDDPALAGCNPTSPQPGCADDFITTFLSHAFRRPITPNEGDRFRGLFSSAGSMDGTAAGAAAVVVAALLSPQFIYKANLGTGQVGAGMLTPLTSPEVASRLAYLLTGAPPDAALLEAAASGSLDGEANLEAQARRLLAAPVFVDSAQHFHEQWFGLAGLDSVQAQGLTGALRESMRSEAGEFIAHVYGGMANLHELLLSSTSYVDNSLALLYGLAPTQAGFVRVELDPTNRAGVLTQLGTLTRFNNPTQRGLLVQNRLLCSQVPPPPPGVDTSLEIQPNQTRRQAWEEHIANPACAACHRLMDPIGFGFESFDELGRFRTTDRALPIDNSGELLGIGDGDGPFTGAVELAQRLSESSLTAECFAQTWWVYATQREPTEVDACAIQQLSAAFKAANLDIRELLVALVKSEQFRFRGAHVMPAVADSAPPSGSATGLAARRHLVLDFVLQELQVFTQRVPNDDRQVVDQYLSSLRELDQKLSAGQLH